MRSCPVLRVVLVRHELHSLATGDRTPAGESLEVQACGVPLFGGALECSSCARGWEHADNRRATAEEAKDGERVLERRAPVWAKSRDVTKHDADATGAP